ncbi:hypothetical protein Osc1_23550 [Hominimerdicola sp. 21CYCFAH17_S]
MNWKINDIMNKYSLSQRNKIKDFLISEIDDENLNETIDFVNSDDKKKREIFSDILYEGNKYTGIFLEGNQYLISSNDNEVKIIDYVGIEHGLIDNSEIIFTLTDFVFLVSHKKMTLEF